VRYTAREQIDENTLEQWIEESKTIQWDYKNLMKTKKLERLF